MTIWLLVVALGAFHGLSPGMGWPLAVSAGLFERSERAILGALAPLALGHLLAMAAVLLPFALLVTYVDFAQPIRLAAALLVIAFAAWRLVDTRHPRALARIRPTQLTLWSFLMATAHGAGLMLLPIYMGLCTGHGAVAGMHATVAVFAGSSLAIAAMVALVHTLAMLAVGGGLAWSVYRFLGLRAIRATWFNLDRVWAASLGLSGAVGLAMAVAG